MKGLNFVQKSDMSFARRVVQLDSGLAVLHVCTSSSWSDVSSAVRMLCLISAESPLEDLFKVALSAVSAHVIGAAACTKLGFRARLET